MNTNISHLRDLKLTQDEWYTLAAVQQGNYPQACHDPNGEDLDMLVLAGLVVRLNEGPPALTTEGVEAATEIDMAFDWEQFAHRPSKAIEEEMVYFGDGTAIARSEAEKLIVPRKHMTVGSLVRHTTSGGVGLITHHTMWDGEWGGFRVQFNKPVDNVVGGKVINQLTQIFDRADSFEFAY
jgi:hypothetical protein|tara:strand:+ start:153 stop:695 length:543 start_codon:yes stop_codon:yes gene_type:complete